VKLDSGAFAAVSSEYGLLGEETTVYLWTQFENLLYTLTLVVFWSNSLLCFKALNISISAGVILHLFAVTYCTQELASRHNGSRTHGYCTPVLRWQCNQLRSHSDFMFQDSGRRFLHIINYEWFREFTSWAGA
jgi:hypothetical protein